ncbi:Uroporphyrinogen_deCOase domain-containing protein [Caenorhabditis elegans]|uniref:Uroporphyrinogen_deCOase domain-containing protein n=1 Tax=Caenorhabditis elegans TaxID=6239 RepID=Q4TTC7_CAEEL|nr:Uroporphyrinogen_deCOase domain-containing protein [Caenorhabditis elegans]pir/T16206/ hypothetical protein F28F5.4 - Caenorhabditis elegans [Caenorhabditis elegans]CCD70168.1 Uroporphyrinogen_deCOase domain-containing protein [Caenorhabditis elegans]|eukprot:NP_001033361.1 Uncharacterized protein CELE_F28F5.4 [Caenorhabditis elegans]
MHKIRSHSKYIIPRLNKIVEEGDADAVGFEFPVESFKFLE